MEESTFMDGVRGVFAVIDRGVYGLITTFYNMIESLTNFTIISSDKINEISGKIYALIALFMIFKISFSLINYLVNPDMLSDKAKGGGALIKNIILTFALVVIVPFGFNILYQAQAAILSDNLIGKFVYGDESVDGEMVFSMDEDECGGITASTSNAGDYIGLMAFRPFFQLSEEKDSSDFTSDLQKMYCSASVNGKDASVKNLLANNKVYSAPHVFSTSHFYVVDYTIFISTAVGIVLVLVLLSFCFDIATRTIKLQFLELLAPIPIISYIDPDQSKNGMFSKWLKEVFNTWLSLFMRLLAFHIAIYLISLIKDVQLEGESLWINLLIIIGVLMFAKELPKLLESIMGIKMSGSFNLNPLKKIGDNALGGKAISKVGGGLAMGAGAMALTSAGSAIANALAAEKGNKFKSAMKGLGTGAFYGATAGYKAGAGGKYNLFGTTLSSVEKNSKNRNLSEDLIKNNVVEDGPFALPRYMIKDKYTDVIGKRGKTGTTDELKDKINSLGIQKQIAQGQQQSANRVLSNLNSSMSSLTSQAISNLKINDRSYDELLDDGRVKWKHDLENITASQYLMENQISFNSESEAERFIQEFDAYIAAEKEYRNAFNDMLAVTKEETKLTKSKDKVEKIGKK